MPKSHAPKQLLDTLLEHPLRKKLEAHEEYRRATSTPEFGQFKLIVSVIEGQIGLSWRQAVEAVTGDGLTAAMDLETQGLAVLAKSRRQGDEPSRGDPDSTCARRRPQ